MRSPSSWGHTYNFPASGGGGYGGGHNLSPTSTDSYGALVHNNNTYNQQGLQALSLKSGHNGTDVTPIPGGGGGGNYNDPRMFQTQLSHRTSPSNSTGANSPPQSLSNSYHSESNIINGLQGSHHSYQTSNVHAAGTNSNPAHSFLGTNSVTINNNYLMNVSPGGTLNLPLSKQYNTTNGGIPRTMEEDANNNNQLSHFRPPPTLYETHGSFGYQSNLKHGYEAHMTDQNGNVNGHHGEELDENSTPKVWRPY